MGTSKGYSLPSGGKWKELKGEANSFTADPTPQAASQLLQSYVKAYGGAADLASRDGRGGGGGGGGGSGPSPAGGGTTAGRETAAYIGGLLSDIAWLGLEQTLRARNLDRLVGKPANEVVDALLDEVVAPGSGFDEVAARRAWFELMGILVGVDATFDEMSRAMEEVLGKTAVYGLVGRFFATYIFQWFCRDFYERWSE